LRETPASKAMWTSERRKKKKRKILASTVSRRKNVDRPVGCASRKELPRQKGQVFAGKAVGSRRKKYLVPSTTLQENRSLFAKASGKGFH